MQAAKGCRNSFACLLERHYDRIHALAWRWTGSETAADDIAQDVTAKLVGAIRNYRGEAAFTTWLYRIVYTTTVDFLRASQRTVAAEPSEIIRLVDANAADGETVSDVNNDLWTAVRALPPQQRDAVLLVYGEDLSHAEAAASMGCSEKTVSWHIHEAKKRLKVLLEAVG